MKRSPERPGGWLFKEEPEHYNFADLELEGTTIWDVVTNNLALKNLRQIRRGDRVLYYHSGTERAIVGEMRVVQGPTPDPDSDDPKAVVVKVKPVRRWKRPLSLARIKQDRALRSWDLVRLPRLSVMPVSAEQWERLECLSREGD